ncbi:hypothetical protein GGTG_06415 [Gaeumannomyces tritici R3-111a-1]|uniref:Uncharacterized protein n=1 Tax=Gaeumannomyces tritici (strain R3-111a-1) TaxID=644352 RepID=J3NYR3_GAET3|nr:hypothetical protein GGTG_06415 [Gaeumannomyces tritici R3-111a-1]EJT76496.1 hypothetical protein GGTG_06415 [Gaeumannomyces tritici R3-111a-1]
MICLCPELAPLLGAVQPAQPLDEIETRQLGTSRQSLATLQSGNNATNADPVIEASLADPVNPIDPVKEPTPGPAEDPIDPVVDPVIDPVVDPVVDHVKELSPGLAEDPTDSVVSPVVDPIIDPVEDLAEDHTAGLAEDPDPIPGPAANPIDPVGPVEDTVPDLVNEPKANGDRTPHADSPTLLPAEDEGTPTNQPRLSVDTGLH